MRVEGYLSSDSLTAAEKTLFSILPSEAAFRAAAMAIATLFSVASATAQENANPQERPSVDQLVKFFDTIAFGSEFNVIKESPVVRKWKLPLRVVVREYGEIVSVTSGGREIRRLEPIEVSATNIGYVQQHLDSLVALTGLQTQDAKKTRWSPNFTINFVPPLQLANPSLADVDEVILSMHPALRHLNRAEMAASSLTAPLHDGARKYYEETGLIK